MNHVRVAAVIPVRMASSRFPGKPLLQVRGLPMVEHVRRRSLLCRGFVGVVVATCDQEIAAAVERFGGTVVLTSPSHPGATDRVAEAARALSCTHVVNVQGDEILVLPEHLDRMVNAITAAPETLAWNAVAPLDAPGERDDPSVVKCVVSVSGRIMYCARRISQPGAFDGGRGPIRKMLGLLGYQRAFLERYGSMPRTPLEAAEAIDQSRVIEHDVILRAVERPSSYPGVNEPREIAAVERHLSDDAAQRSVLSKILSFVAERTLVG